MTACIPWPERSAQNLSKRGKDHAHDGYNRQDIVPRHRVRIARQKINQSFWHEIAPQPFQHGHPTVLTRQSQQRLGNNAFTRFEA